MYICDSSPQTMESWWFVRIPQWDSLKRTKCNRQTNTGKQQQPNGLIRDVVQWAWFQGDICNAEAQPLEVRGETNLWASHALRRVFTSVNVWVASEHQSKAQSFYVDDNVDQSTAFNPLPNHTLPQQSRFCFVCLFNKSFHFFNPPRLVEQEVTFFLFSSFSRPRLLEHLIISLLASRFVLTWKKNNRC